MKVFINSFVKYGIKSGLFKYQKSLNRLNGIQYSSMPEITEKYPNIKTYEELHAFSLQQPQEFWSLLAQSQLSWRQPFSTICEVDPDTAVHRWFPDGKLSVSENCVDRHASRNPDKVALIWEKDEPGQHETVTYKELQDLVCRFSNLLLDSGVAPGDRVVIYLPPSPVAIAAMLAAGRVGAVHSVVFAGFSKEALADRINDAGAETVITCDQGVRGGKVIDLKGTVDAAIEKCPFVKRVFVAKRTGAKVKMGKKDIDLEQSLAAASPNMTALEQGGASPLFLLYTSGSTGRPKGIAHSVAGYLLYAAVTHKQVFDYRDGDIFGCVADIGWITGHSYVVYGPLANGATTVLFESTPIYPKPDRYWEMVSRLGITQFYCAPTALRLLLRSGDDHVTKHDLSKLRVLGSVGEPLNTEAWHWYHEVVGKEKCDVVDTWWQTETGGIMLSPRPSAPKAKILSGMPMRPMFSIQPELFSSDGQKISENNRSGALCIKATWPGIAQTIYGDHQRFIDTYFKPFPGYFFTGDGATRNESGYYQITGRMDDVINVAGHRLGTAEVEDILCDHPDVAECAVVGFPHDLKGEGVFVFAALKDAASTPPETIKDQLKTRVKQGIASFAVPDNILIVPGLPKTRSGKVMRRILRKIAAGQTDQLGDMSTLAEPTVVEKIVKICTQK